MVLETNYGGTTSGQNYWYSQIDVGTLESGSSGSPVFNQQSRVVGQLSGGSPGCFSNKRFWHGCFHRSWTGGGTNNTRLSNWLNPLGTGATTLNSVRPNPEYSGIPEQLCSTTTFSVTSLPPGYTFQQWNGNNVTFSNNTSNPVQVTPVSNGEAWVEAVVYTGWGNYTMERQEFWVGAPNAPNNITRFPSNGKKFAIDSYYEFYVSPQQGATYFTWNVSGGTIVEGQGTSFVLVRTASYPTNFSLSIKSGNNCGESSYFTRTGYVVDEDLPIDAIPPDETSAEIDTSENNLIELKQGFIPAAYTIIIAPNPATGETTLTIETNFSEKTFNETGPWNLEIFSGTQILKTRQTGLRGQSAKIQTAGWQEGIYIVRVNYNNEIFTGKLMVKR